MRTCSVLDSIIRDFIDAQKRRVQTDGVVVVGSYAQGRYGPDSDIDILCLTKDARVPVARHITHLDTRFHLLLVSAERLCSLLTTETQNPFAIGVLHSLTAGRIVLEDSQALHRTVSLAERLVAIRGIEYDLRDRDIIVLHGVGHRITKPGGCWKLTPIDTTGDPGPGPI